MNDMNKKILNGLLGVGVLGVMTLVGAQSVQAHGGGDRIREEFRIKVDDDDRDRFFDRRLNRFLDRRFDRRFDRDFDRRDFDLDREFRREFRFERD